MKKETFNAAGKTIEIYYSEKADAPIVYSCDFTKDADAVWHACSQIGCPAFHLVSVTDIHWDEEMSPWAHEPVVDKNDHFTGEADQFLEKMEKEIIPLVKARIPNSTVSILNGYSMGGLFTLYAAHKSVLFDAYAAPSGSVWYPDFMDFVKNNGFKKQPKAIYLSIGDRESRTRHPYLSQTEKNMQVLQALYQDRQITSIFELNPGNHFKNVNNRVAKGLKWILDTLES